MTKALFPGTFDPVTNGHLNIIKRAARLFDLIDVVIAENDDKKCLFSVAERLDFIKDSIRTLEHFENVTVHAWSGLIVDYAKESGAKVLIRGIRNTLDFSYEFELSLMNHVLSSNVETLFIPTNQKYLLLRSSSIKELARLGGDVSAMVPPAVAEALKKKFSSPST